MSRFIFVFSLFLGLMPSLVWAKPVVHDEFIDMPSTTYRADGDYGKMTKLKGVDKKIVRYRETIHELDNNQEEHYRHTSLEFPSGGLQKVKEIDSYPSKTGAIKNGE